MMKRLSIALAIAVVCGIVAGVVWGSRAGASAGILAAVIGAIVAVLVRNQKDLHEIEEGHVPEPVERAMGESDERLP